MVVTGVQEYLESLPEAVITRLFRSPSSCLAIFRLLAPLAKSIVLSTIFTDGPLQLQVIDNLVKSGHKRLQVEALQSLKRIHVVKERYAAQALQINLVFRDSLRCALTSGPQNTSFGVPSDEETTKKLDKEALNKYSKEKWERILHYMVGSSSEYGDSSPPGKGVLELLRQSGLMGGSSSQHLQITSAGFQFLLQDLNSQLWTMLLHYLDMASNLQMDPVEVLNLIFMLGSLELGKAYSLSELSETQVKMVGDLADLGIVYLKSGKSQHFYPASLATILTSDTDTAEVEVLTSRANSSRGMIIIETNYRLYAYTESPLQMSILALFCHLKARFSNLVVGRISRESIRRALVRGISADQIIQYLSTNAHEQMREKAKGQVLPPTVSDQIKLWQLELDRFRATQGFLYRDFPSSKEYQLIVSYAQDMGALIWKNDNKRMFFVEKDSNGQVLDYVNRKMH